MTMRSTDSALDIASSARLEMTSLPPYIRAAAVGAAMAEQQSTCCHLNTWGHVLLHGGGHVRQ